MSSKETGVGIQFANNLNYIYITCDIEQSSDSRRQISYCVSSFSHITCKHENRYSFRNETLPEEIRKQVKFLAIRHGCRRILQGFRVSRLVNAKFSLRLKKMDIWRCNVQGSVYTERKRKRKRSKNHQKISKCQRQTLKKIFAFAIVVAQCK